MQLPLVDLSMQTVSSLLTVEEKPEVIAKRAPISKCLDVLPLRDPDFNAFCQRFNFYLFLYNFLFQLVSRAVLIISVCFSLFENIQ